jgi:hypothetical protein
MSETIERDYVEPTGWVGWIWFAALMLIMLGIFNIILGLAALIEDEYVAVTSEGLLLFDITGWGWIHLITGVVQLIAGFALFSGATWARAVAAIVAIVSAVSQVTFLSASPVWSLLIIALDVLVLWAVIVHGREAKAL